MAFATRYQGVYKDFGGFAYTVRIMADGWADPAETIVISRLTLSYDPGNSDLFYNSLPTSISIQVLDNISTSSRLLSLIAAEERQYRIELDAPGIGIWSFWLKPSQIAYFRDRPETTTINGIGGLGFLKDLAYTDGAGDPVTGRESISAILRRCFEFTGFAFDYVVSWFNWYARSTGGFEADGLNMLSHLAVDNARFLDDDGNPFSVHEVLVNQIAAGLDLQVMTWGGQFVAMQRRRDYNAGANTQRVFLDHKTLGEAESDAVFFLDIDWSSNFRLEGFLESHQQARVQSSIVYDHGTPETGIIGNAGFEAPIELLGGSNDGNWLPVGSASIVRRSGMVSEGAWALEMPPALNSIPIVTVPDDINASVYVEQLAGFVEGQAGRRLTVQFDVALDFINEAPSTNVFYFLASVEIVGDSQTWKVYRDAFGVYRLSTAVSAPDDRLAFQWGFVLDYQTISIPIEELHDGTNPTTGRLKIRAYRAVQDNIGQPAAEFNSSLLDNFRFTVTEASGETANTATKTTCIDTASGNTAAIEGPTVRFGSGPTSGHIARLTVLDDLGAEDGDATDFQIGDNYAAPASSRSRDAVFCDERLKQTGIPLGQLRGRLLVSEPLGYAPFMALRDQRFMRSVASHLSGETEIEIYSRSSDNPAGRPDAGFLPGRRIAIGAGSYLVTECINNEDGTYALRISPGLSGAILVDTLISQTIFYTARRASYDLATREIDGAWDEYYEGAGGDLILETNIRPGSPGAPSIGAGSVIVNVIGGAGAGLVTVNSVTELRNIAGTGAGPVWMKSVQSGLELGSGLWIADQADVSTADNTGTVVAGLDGVRWKRQGLEGAWRTEWFGARWNGVTDDAAAIQATIDAAPAGGKIDLPGRITVIGTELLIDGKPLTIEGASDSYWSDTGYQGAQNPPGSGLYPNAFPAFPGWAGTVLRSAAGLTGSIFKIQDTVTTSERRNAARLRFMHLVGNRIPQNSGTASDVHGVHVLGGWWVKLESLSINGFTSHGVHAERSPVGALFVTDLLQVDRCHISDNGGWGVAMSQPDSWVTHCRISHNVLGGVLLGATQCRVTQNWIDINAGSGVRGNGARANQITENIIDANGSAGVWIGDGTVSVSDYIVRGNQISNNGRNGALPIEQRSGIWIWGGRDFIVTENSIVENNTTGLDANGDPEFRQTYGLYISNGWRNHTITPNKYRGNIFGQTNLLTKNPAGVYNVLQYGVMQRTNDASPHIQALIDSVDEGSTIFFPEGNALLLSSIVVNKALRFLGLGTDDSDGNEGSFIQGDSTLNAPCFIVNAGGVVFERLNFKGSALSPSNAASAIQFAAGTFGRVDRCVISDFKGPAVDILGPASNINIHDSILISGDDHGVIVRGSNCQIHGTEARQNAGHGVYILGGNDARVSNCFTWSNGLDGIRIEGGARALVTINNSRSNGQAGIRIQSGTGHKVEHNTTNTNGLDTGVANIHRAGVAVIAGDRLSVSHNYAGGQQHGLTFGAGVVSCQVLDNAFESIAVSDYLFDPASKSGLDIDLFGAVEINLASIGAGAKSETSVTLGGVIANDVISVGLPASWNTDLDAYAFVSADDTIKFVVKNRTAGAIDPANATFQFMACRRGGTAAATPPAPSLSMIIQHRFTNYNLLLHG